VEERAIVGPGGFGRRTEHAGHPPSLDGGDQSPEADPFGNLMNSQLARYLSSCMTDIPFSRGPVGVVAL